MPKNIGTIRKQVVQMAYLSVLSPGKCILDIFGKSIVRSFFDCFLAPRLVSPCGVARHMVSSIRALLLVGLTIP